MSDDICDDPECMCKRPQRIIDELVGSTKVEVEGVPSLGFDDNDPLSKISSEDPGP